LGTITLDGKEGSMELLPAEMNFEKSIGIQIAQNAL
jgi:hypothetical protein